MIPDPNQFKDKFLNEFRKASETGLLKSKFLYSTVVERPLEKSDFDIILDESNIAASTIAAKFFSRIYLSLTHREQKKILSMAVNKNEQMLENLDEMFTSIEKLVDEYFTKINQATTERDVLTVVVELVQTAVNYFREAMYNKINLIPAALYKKIHLAVFRDKIDLTFLIDLILDEKERQSNMESKKLASQCSLVELENMLYSYILTSNSGAVSIVQKAIEIKKGENS